MHRPRWERAEGEIVSSTTYTCRRRGHYRARTAKSTSLEHRPDYRWSPAGKSPAAFEEEASSARSGQCLSLARHTKRSTGRHWRGRAEEASGAALFGRIEPWPSWGGMRRSSRIRWMRLRTHRWKPCGGSDTMGLQLPIFIGHRCAGFSPIRRALEDHWETTEKRWAARAPSQCPKTLIAGFAAKVKAGIQDRSIRQERPLRDSYKARTCGLILRGWRDVAAFGVGASPPRRAWASLATKLGHGVRMGLTNQEVVSSHSQ